MSNRRYTALVFINWATMWLNKIAARLSGSPKPSPRIDPLAAELSPKTRATLTGNFQLLNAVALAGLALDLYAKANDPLNSLAHWSRNALHRLNVYATDTATPEFFAEYYDELTQRTGDALKADEIVEV